MATAMSLLVEVLVVKEWGDRRGPPFLVGESPA